MCRIAVKVERLKAIKAKLHGRRGDRVRPACEDIEKEPLRLSRGWRRQAVCCILYGWWLRSRQRRCGCFARLGWQGRRGCCGPILRRLRIWAGSRKFAAIFGRALKLAVQDGADMRESAVVRSAKARSACKFRSLCR